MKLKDLLEKIHFWTVVKVTLYSKKSEMHKEFISRVSDLLEEKLWLEKEVACISLDLGEDEDDQLTKINIELQDE